MITEDETDGDDYEDVIDDSPSEFDQEFGISSNGPNRQRGLPPHFTHARTDIFAFSPPPCVPPRCLSLVMSAGDKHR